MQGMGGISCLNKYILAFIKMIDNKRLLINEAVDMKLVQGNFIPNHHRCYEKLVVIDENL